MIPWSRPYPGSCRGALPPSERDPPKGLSPSGAISTSVHPVFSTFSAGIAKISVAGFEGRLFGVPIAAILVISAPKIGQYMPVTGGKVGLGRACGVPLHQPVAGHA